MNQQDVDIIIQHLISHYQTMRHEPVAAFKRPYIVPGGAYQDCMWDWDSFFAAKAIFAIMDMTDAAADIRARMIEAMQGTIHNFLDFQLSNGAIPHSIYMGGEDYFRQMVEEMDEPNQHKPVLAQFIQLVVEQTQDVEWIRPQLQDVCRFIQHYREAYFDERTGLYFWRSGAVIGVDNDPCTFGRPRNSSASIFLNSLMIAELAALAALLQQTGHAEQASVFQQHREDVIAAVHAYCWDSRDQFFYSADILCHTEHDVPWLNSGLGVFWHAIPLRIRLWTGFMPLWAGFATHEQAAQLVRLHLFDENALACDYGIRSLAANEPMYDCRATANPSNWLGPVWMISNYMVFKGLRRYHFNHEAQIFGNKVIKLLARDLRQNGTLHEYYIPETGIGVMNPGFMNWNFLISEMIRDMQALESAI